MDFFSRLFFESPIRLGVFCFLLFAATLLARRRRPGSAADYALPATLALTLLLFIVQRMVVTQREQIWRRLDDFIAAVERHDAAKIGGIVSENYQSEGMDRASILAYIDDRLRSLRVYDTRVAGREVNIAQDQAEMDLAAAATVRAQGGVGDRHVGRWRINWSHEDGEWNIRSIQPRMIDMVQVGSLRELQGLTP